MIRVNLLNSVTERHSGAAAAVERKVGSPVSRLLLMSIAVVFLTIALIGWDVISTQMAKADAQSRLEEQQRIATELEAVMKEQKELEAKISLIDARITAIKKLRDEQSGPSAVLEALRERISMVSGLYLDTVEQKGDQLEIKGTSNDETAPTRFGQSLEFSGGLFSNLGIETTRREETAPGATPAATNSPDAPKVVSFDFVIRCAYSPKAAQGTNPTTAAAQPGPAGPQANPTPQQVAKN